MPRKKPRMPFVLLNLPSTYIIQSIHINKAFRWLIFLFERIAWEHLAKINVTKTLLAYLYTVIHTIKNHAILNLEIIKKIIELKHVLCVNGRMLDTFHNVYFNFNNSLPLLQSQHSLTCWLKFEGGVLQRDLSLYL